MSSTFCFFICLLATTIGAISGIGGGVIIKPVLDAVSTLSTATISFLSGCTVLSMTIVSLIRSQNDDSKIEKRTATPLALGAAFGGILGKQLFDVIRSAYDNSSVGVVQNVVMVFLTVFVLWFQIRRDKIKYLHVRNLAGCFIIGFVLGMISAFLGIGGGPINLVVLYFFFSMDTKTAAVNSIYIIFFSQITSLASTILTGSIPEFDVSYLVIMITGGILGGFMGRSVSRRLSNKHVDILFMLLLTVIIVISCYNVYHFKHLV